MVYSLMKRFLFLFDPERAHRLALFLLGVIRSVPGGRRLVRWICAPRGAKPVSLWGLEFANPIGLAAGFDKNAAHVGALFDLGFGFVEVGSVTAEPWAGNPTPRLFRLPVDRAVVNRMGLNNQGSVALAARLSELRRRGLAGPLFVNVAKTPDPSLEGAAAVADYCASVDRLKELADVVVVNISCPNSGDGRTFEDPEALEALLKGVRGALGESSVPLLVKVSPDLDPGQLKQVVELADRYGVDGFTATNTTVSREGLQTAPGVLSTLGAGGLSGAPLHSRALRTVTELARLTPKPIIGVGGVMGAVEAKAMLAAGASLVQIYTGFIYRGPTVVRQTCKGLSPLD